MHEHLKLSHRVPPCVRGVPLFDVMDEFPLLLPQNGQFLKSILQRLQSGRHPGLRPLEDWDTYPSRQVVQGPTAGHVRGWGFWGSCDPKDCVRIHHGGLVLRGPHH